MHKVMIRQIRYTNSDVVDPADYADWKYRIWHCLMLDYIPQLGTEMVGQFCKGLVTRVEHSGMEYDICKIDLADNQDALEQNDVTVLRSKLMPKNKFPHEFEGRYIIEAWEKIKH